MLKPVRMQKVLLLATKSSESRLISALHRTGLVQINTLDVAGLERGRPLPVHDDVSRELVRARSLIAAFQSLDFMTKAKSKPAAEKLESEPNYDSSLRAAASISIDDQLRDLIKARADLTAQSKELDRKLLDISKASYFPDVDFSTLNTKNFTYALGSVKSAAFAKFSKDLEEYLPEQCRIMDALSGKEQKVVLAFYPRKENIDFVLSRYNFERLELPAGFTTFKGGKAALEKESAELRGRIAKAEKELIELHDRYMPWLLKCETELSLLSERSSIATKFASGRKIIAISGWLKQGETKNLQSMLERDFAGDAELAKQDDEHGAPIVLDNPKVISEFQWLVEFYSLPDYSEFDPTVILLFTVPIIYGMIVGDVGYGIISIFLSLLILQKFKEGMLGNVAKIWLFSSIAAMAFGVVFNEWFGMSLEQLLGLSAAFGIHAPANYGIYEGLSRAEKLPLVMAISILVGVVQLSFGFVLGALNAWGHDKKHAMAKVAWLGVLLGGTVAVCVFILLPAGALPVEFGYAGAAALVLGTIIVTYVEGLAGLFEVPGLAANTLSYARIAAAGVAGVIIAEIINGMFSPANGGLLVLPLFIILHTLNAGLAMFESIVQGGRLNLVEFYSKFFHGGGKAFEPFAMGDLKETK